MKYAAFLRGINVGGNALVKMTDLKRLMEATGFKEVKTLLASGNVVFDAPRGDAKKIATKIEAVLKKKYMRDIAVIVLSIDDLKKLDATQPFKGIKVTPETPLESRKRPLTGQARLYVTFLYEKPKSHLKLAPSKVFYLTKKSDTAICSVLILTPDRSTIDLMAALEKHYGKLVTTRNWNTVQKILKA